MSIEEVARNKINNEAEIEYASGVCDVCVFVREEEKNLNDTKPTTNKAGAGRAHGTVVSHHDVDRHQQE